MIYNHAYDYHLSSVSIRIQAYIHKVKANLRHLQVTHNKQRGPDFNNAVIIIFTLLFIDIREENILMDGHRHISRYTKEY